MFFFTPPFVYNIYVNCEINYKIGIAKCGIQKVTQLNSLAYDFFLAYLKKNLDFQTLQSKYVDFIASYDIYK